MLPRLHTMGADFDAGAAAEAVAEGADRKRCPLEIGIFSRSFYRIIVGAKQYPRAHHNRTLFAYCA